MSDAVPTGQASQLVPHTGSKQTISSSSRNAPVSPSESGETENEPSKQRAAHRARNSSVVSALFEGFCTSSLCSADSSTCPHRSETCEPFLCISLPIASVEGADAPARCANVDCSTTAADAAQTNSTAGTQEPPPPIPLYDCLANFFHEETVSSALLFSCLFIFRVFLLLKIILFLNCLSD